MKLNLFSMGVSAALLLTVGCGEDGSNPFTQDASTGGQDASTGGQDASTGGQDASSGGQDASTGGQDASSGGQDASSGGQDASTGGQDAGSGGQDAGTPPAPIGLQTLTSCGVWANVQDAEGTHTVMRGSYLAGSFSDNGTTKCLIAKFRDSCDAGDTEEWDAPAGFDFCGMNIHDGACSDAVMEVSSLSTEAKLEGSLLQNGETVAVNLTITPDGSQQRYTLKTEGTPLNVKNRSCQHYTWSPDDGVIDQVSGCYITRNGDVWRAYGYDFKKNGAPVCAVVQFSSTDANGDVEQRDFTASSNFYVSLNYLPQACDPDDLFSAQPVPSDDVLIFGGSEVSPHPYIPDNGTTGTITGWLRSSFSQVQLEFRLDAQDVNLNVDCDP